jgi:hypothetical protein
MLRAKYDKCYPKIDKNGNRVKIFMYRVTGSESEINKYKDIREAEGRLSLDDNGQPLFHTLEYHGDNVELMITINDKIAVDTSDWDKARAAAEQNPYLAGEIAKLMIGKLGLGRSNNSTGEPVREQQNNNPFGN